MYSRYAFVSLFLILLHVEDDRQICTAGMPLSVCSLYYYMWKTTDRYVQQVCLCQFVPYITTCGRRQTDMYSRYVFVSLFLILLHVEDDRQICTAGMSLSVCSLYYYMWKTTDRYVQQVCLCQFVPYITTCGRRQTDMYSRYVFVSLLLILLHVEDDRQICTAGMPLSVCSLYYYMWKTTDRYVQQVCLCQFVPYITTCGRRQTDMYSRYAFVSLFLILLHVEDDRQICTAGMSLSVCSLYYYMWKTTDRYVQQVCLCQFVPYITTCGRRQTDMYSRYVFVSLFLILLHVEDDRQICTAGMSLSVCSLYYYMWKTTDRYVQQVCLCQFAPYITTCGRRQTDMYSRYAFVSLFLILLHVEDDRQICTAGMPLSVCSLYYYMWKTTDRYVQQVCLCQFVPYITTCGRRQTDMYSRYVFVSLFLILLHVEDDRQICTAGMSLSVCSLYYYMWKTTDRYVQQVCLCQFVPYITTCGRRQTDMYSRYVFVSLLLLFCHSGLFLHDDT